MEIIIGIGVLLVLVAIILFELGIMSQKETKEIPQMTEEQKKKKEKISKSFDNLMQYDYEKALKSKGE